MQRMNETASDANTFETDAGPAEMEHFQELLDELDDTELRKLVKGVGMVFEAPLEEIDRDTLEGVLDETDRETFYREYNWRLEARQYSDGPDPARFSKLYADACQAYIDLAKNDKLPRDDAARRMSDEQPKPAIHPMLRAAASYASDIADDYRGPEDREHYWERTLELVRDFRAGKWCTTRWTLAANYIHHQRTHGMSLVIEMRRSKPHIAIADKTLEKVIRSTLSKLNTDQTEQRFLQNVAFVLPKEFGGYNRGRADVYEALRL
jgi:hypothetical protein